MIVVFPFKAVLNVFNGPHFQKADSEPELVYRRWKVLNATMEILLFTLYGLKFRCTSNTLNEIMLIRNWLNPWKKVSSNCFRVRSIAMKRHTMCSLLVGRPRLFYVCAYVFAPDPPQCSFFKNCESLKLARLSIRNMAKVA